MGGCYCTKPLWSACRSAARAGHPGCGRLRFSRGLPEAVTEPFDHVRQFWPQDVELIALWRCSVIDWCRDG